MTAADLVADEAADQRTDHGAAFLLAARGRATQHPGAGARGAAQRQTRSQSGRREGAAHRLGVQDTHDDLRPLRSFDEAGLDG